MSRLITVFIECKSGEVRQAFEKTFSRKPGLYFDSGEAVRRGGCVDSRIG